MSTRTRGFTLIELLIALAILAIIVGVAYPAYTGYVTRARQASAQQFMMDIANAEETYRADVLNYVAGATTADVTTNLNLTPSSDIARYYVFTVTGVTPLAYTITATPRNGQPGPTFTIDQAGTKTGW